MKMLLTSCLLMLSLMHPGLRTASGQETQTVDPLVRVHLENTTVAIAHLDLSKVDFQVAIKWIVDRSGRPAPEHMTTVKVVGTTLVRSLLDAGPTHLYATASTLDIPHGGVVLFLPCRDIEAVKLVVETLVAQGQLKQLGYKVFASEGLVVVAQPRTWSRIANKPDAGREELTAAIQVGAGKAMALAINLPDQLRHEVAQIWPEKAPSEWRIQLSPKQLMNDIRSITLVADLPPSPSISAVMRGESDSSVDRTRQVLEQLAATLPQPAGGITLTSDNQMLTLTMKESLQIEALQHVLTPIRQAAEAARSSNNLKQIMLAMHNYYSTYNYLPPRETRSKADQPLLSWRVHILPYLDQQELFDKFHLDEPWNSPHNTQLIEQMPLVYVVEGDQQAQGKTRYLLPMLQGGAWVGEDPPRKFNDLTDGTSNTIAVVTAPKENSVIWTKPEELALKGDQIVELLFGKAESIQAGWFDGSVRQIMRSSPPKDLQAAITMAGGEVFSLE